MRSGLIPATGPAAIPAVIDFEGELLKKVVEALDRTRIEYMITGSKEAGI